MNSRILNFLKKNQSKVAGLISTGLLAAFIVPFMEDEGWKSLSFRNIPAHEVQFGEDQLTLQVNKSANPVVYPLPNPMKVSRVKVKATWEGEFQIPEGLKQGEKGADDYVLRVGLVISGDKTLNFVQRRIAANWIKQLHALAPEGTGISQIYFLNVGASKEHEGSKRTHPLSDLLYEHVVHTSAEPGKIEFEHSFDAPKEVLGLWISSDGDDIDAKFDIEIKSIALHP